MDKKLSRLRRAKKARCKIKSLGINRLSVHRTPKHIYAQVITADGSQVLAEVSTVQSAVSADVKSTGNIAAASVVGKLIGEKALAAGVEQVAFDRSGYKYHGRVKALADAAREAGLKF